MDKLKLVKLKRVENPVVEDIIKEWIDTDLGDYNVIVTDEEGCFWTRSIDINESQTWTKWVKLTAVGDKIKYSKETIEVRS